MQGSRSVIRFRSVFIILMLLFSTFAIVSVSGQTDKTEEKPIMTVKGTVSVAETDKVIQKAWVYIHNDDFELETHTDENGFYSAKLTPGWYVIKVGAEGFHEQKAEIKGEADAEIIQDFFLKPIIDHEPSDEGLTLCGIVTDERENPIAWAVVGIERMLDEEETDDWAYHARTETDEDGYYEFTGLKEGWYFVNAEAEGYHEYFDEIKLPFEDHEETDTEREQVNKLHIILERFRDDGFHFTALHGQVFDACTDRPLAGARVIITRGAFQPCDLEAIKGPCPPGDPEWPDKPPQEKPDDYDDKKDYEDKDEPERERTRCGDDCDEDRERDRERDEDCRPKDREVEEFFMWSINSNDDGFYEFSGLMPGHYNLWVIAKGYITFYNEYDIHDEGMNVNVYLRPMLFDKPLMKKPNALIKGHVFDEETEEPLAGVKVVVLDPSEAFKPELLDEKPLEKDPEYQDRPVEKPEEGRKTRGEGCGDCGNEREDVTKERPELEKKPIEPDRLPGFTTTTDREGYFELKVPDGAHVLVVIAPGYYRGIQKFVIEPEEVLTVRVPMKFMDESGTRPGNEGELAGDESSEADAKSSSWIPTGAEATGAMLNAVLAGLLVVLVILSMFVFRKYKRKPVIKIKKVK